VAGLPTSAGNPDWLATHPRPARSAVAVERLVGAGAVLVGKTVTDELAFSLAGTNVHYGTPANPAAPGRVPGGSSSGSASAVAAGQADIGLGTDTAGSVRVPASYCGLVGVRPTWGRVPLDGCVPLAPGYDTVGWFTRSGQLAVEVGRALLDPWEAGQPLPFQRLLIATDGFRLADEGLIAALRPGVQKLADLIGAWREEPIAGGQLEQWAQGFRIDQARQVWRAHGEWISKTAPRFGPGVAARFGWAATITDGDLAATKAVRRQARRRLEEVLPGTVVCLPAATGPAPPPDLEPGARDDLRARTLALTCPAGLAGAPCVSLPAGRLDGCPVNLTVMAAPGADEALLQLSAAYMGESGG
jgi:amidase